MPQEWYCQIMDSEVGPLTSSQLREMANTGRLKQEDLIRKGNSSCWITASQVKGLFTISRVPSTLLSQSQRTEAPSFIQVSSNDPRLTSPSLPKSGNLPVRRRTSFARQHLMRDETILSAATIHPLIFLSSVICFLCPLVGFSVLVYSLLEPDVDRMPVAWAWLGLLSFPLILAGLFFPFKVINALIVFFTTECVLTDMRILGKKGLIRRETIEIHLSKIEGFQVKQSILGRMFNFGSVTITGTGGLKNPFQGIANPLDFRSLINEQIAKLQPR